MFFLLIFVKKLFFSPTFFSTNTLIFLLKIAFVWILLNCNNMKSYHSLFRYLPCIFSSFMIFTVFIKVSSFFNHYKTMHFIFIILELFLKYLTQHTWLNYSTVNLIPHFILETHICIYAVESLCLQTHA